MTLVAGIDCSTQATKVLVCDAETGAVVRSGRAAHPDQTEVDPAVWWAAWQKASDGLLDDVAALAVGGQQHGMVLVDDSGTPVRDALLWNDNRSAVQAQQLIDELGGPAAWASGVGSVPVASFTVTKLRWVAEHEPEVARRATGVALPHDWLTHRLIIDAREFVTDRGDASGTGYWSPAADDYRPDLLRRAFGTELEVPRVAGTHEPLGHTASGAVVAPGTGDNMAAALGLGLRSGDLAVSLGTSGTVFAVTDQPTADETGIVAGFADASGRFLPLVCTLNAARVLSAAASIAGVDLDELDALATSVDDTDGLVLLPYLDGERTPPLPEATGLLHGLTRRNATPAHLARAAVEGMLCGLADAVEALRTHGVAPRRVVLIGGAARAGSVQRIASELFGLEVVVPEPGEYVALGAARQAAWTLIGSDHPPTWSVSGHTIAPEADRIAAGERALSRYRETLGAAGPLLSR
ncbi:MAG TPA: xylulokinase [Nocardioidaceae bacterium]|nr:xylulokinase [Nocardioidaceae bacterium]